MRLKSINVFSGFTGDLQDTKNRTGQLRKDSQIYFEFLKLLKYYNNENCKSLNMCCDENTKDFFVESIGNDGYPIVHIPFDYNEYKTIPEYVKNKYWLKKLDDTIQYLCELWDWDYETFSNVLNIINENDK